MHIVSNKLNTNPSNKNNILQESGMKLKLKKYYLNEYILYFINSSVYYLFIHSSAPFIVKL